MTRQKPLNIAMLGPFGLHPNKTMRSRAFQLAKEQVKRGHRVEIIMPPWQTPEEAGKVWQEDGVTFRYVSLSGGLPLIVWRMLTAVRQFEPDVVHAFKPKAYSGLTLWCLWQLRRFNTGKRPLLITDTDDWEGAGGWNDRAPYTAVQKHFFAWQEKWGLTHCDQLTVASRALETLAWGHGTPHHKVIYLPNSAGIKTPTLIKVAHAQKRASLGIKPDQPTLLLYSRLFEFNTGRLVAILADVAKEIPDLAILAVGAGLYDDEAATMRQQLKKTNLLDKMIDTGWLNEEALPNVLTIADVGIYLMEDDLLNRTKCPVKLADMLHVGVPVVGEQVGQVSEYIVAGETGLLRPSGDHDGLVADLIGLLQDRELRGRLATQAKHHMQQHFSWEKHAKTLDYHYHQALSQQ